MRPALIDPRIARMIRRDMQVAAASVVALWLIFGFVFWQIAGISYSAAPGFVVLGGVLALAILVINTLSIYELTRRCSNNAEIGRIYGPEVQSDDATLNASTESVQFKQKGPSSDG